MHSNQDGKSLATYLTQYYATAFIAVLLLTFSLLYLSISSVIDKRVDEDLKEDISEMSSLLEQHGMDRLKQEIDYETHGIDAQYSFLKVYDKNSVLLYASNDNAWLGLSIESEKINKLFENKSDYYFTTIDLDSQEDATRIVYGLISDQYALVIGDSLQNRSEVMELLLKACLVILLIAIPIASILVWLMTKRAVAGVQSVSQAALDISCGNLTRRANSDEHIYEVKTLANTFNAMADRIQELIKNMREVTDNMAHDLRTPLGRIRALSDSVLNRETSTEQYRTAAALTIEECDRLINMINISLDVAEAETGVAPLNKETIHMQTLLADACELFEPLAEQHNIRIELGQDTDCKLQGDLNSLQRLFSNLLDNAIKYTQPGGSIRVSLNCDEEFVKVSLRDTGIGIPEKDLTHIFDRFYRCDQSRERTGCGLGLSYARAVVNAHGGQIQVASVAGEGSTFSVELPIKMREQFIAAPKQSATTQENQLIHNK